MNIDEELYELIFCSMYGAVHRDELLEKYKDRLSDLKSVHKRFGFKINREAIPFEDCR